MANNTSHLRPDRRDEDSSSTQLDPIDFEIRAEEIYFPEQSHGYYCICFADIVNSTQIISKIADDNKIRKYYAIFLNAMATIAKNFGAKVVKNVGDALIFYFPSTSNSDNATAFRDVLECCTAIVAAHEFINIKLQTEDLPPVSYRISIDYGKVEVATTVTSGAEDLFGPTVSMCAKINSYAEPNGIVIGGDLYQIVKRLSFEKDYEFKEVNKWSSSMKYVYPIYSVARKDKLLARDNVLKVFRRRDDMTAKKESLLSRSSSPPSFIMHPLPFANKTNSCNQFNIIIVDDEPDILATFKAYLDAEKYHVEAFSDSYDALLSFAKSEPGYYDLVILDIRMPTMNGLQLYQRLKTVDPHIKVIFLSALDATDELVSILDGVKSVDVLRKPIDKKHFIQKIKSIVLSSD